MGAVPAAVVLGGDITALSVARSLRAAGITVYVLDGPTSPARVSRSVAEFVDVGTERPQERMLAWLQAAELGAVLLAGADDGVELLARYRGELISRGYHPAEADPEVLLAMLDKLRTYELARAAGVAAPRVIALRGESALDSTIEELDFPCVLKPVHSHLFTRRGGANAKVIVVSTPAELRAEYARLSALGLEMFVTEVVRGPSDEFVSYYGYLDEQGDTLVDFTKRKIRQWPPGFGVGTYHETTNDADVAEAGLRFLRSVRMRGLGNVEFKRRSEDGQLILIECNPRFTMSNELIRAAGADLALLCYNRALGRPVARIAGYDVGLHLWEPITDTRAFMAYRRGGELGTREWLASLMHSQCLPALRLDDPFPALLRARTMLAHARAPRRVEAPVPSTGAPAARAKSEAKVPGAGTTRLRVRPTWSMRNRVLDRLAAGGPRSRAVAARVDLTCAVGIGPVLRRVRAERRFAQMPAVRDRLYERIWGDAGTQCGAEVVRLAPGLLEIRRNGARTRVYHQFLELDDPVTLRIALDKTLVHRLTAEVGVNHVEHLEWTAEEPRAALSFLARAGGPCVVKPAAGTGGGHGVVPGVETPEDLLRARWHAGSQTDRLLIERQVDGWLYRLLLLDGELLDVVRSVPSNVTGDGRSTLEELIAEENERRLQAGGDEGLSLIGANLDMVLTLRRAGLRLSSVLPEGRHLTLRLATNNNAARDNETWRGLMCKTVLEEARAAVAAVGLRLAGVDVITSDLTRPLAETGGVISEVNGGPGIHHHYLVADPAHANPVAVPVLETLLGLPTCA